MIIGSSCFRITTICKQAKYIFYILTEPPKDVEEAKPEVVSLVDLLSAKMIDSNNDTQ